MFSKLRSVLFPPRKLLLIIRDDGLDITVFDRTTLVIFDYRTELLAGQERTIFKPTEMGNGDTYKLLWGKGEN